MKILQGTRPLDHLLTAALAAVAVLIGVENMSYRPGADVAHPVESQSVLMIPVFLLAVLPIVLRRRDVLLALAASVVVTAASVPAFGWVTRCGWALPLSIAFAYAVARFAGARRRHLLGLVGVLALQVVALVQDSSTGGLGALALAVPLAALAYGAGLLVQSRAAERSSRQASAPSLDAEHAHA